MSKRENPERNASREREREKRGEIPTSAIPRETERERVGCVCGIVLRFGIQDTGVCFAGSLHTSSRLVSSRSRENFWVYFKSRI